MEQNPKDSEHTWSILDAQLNDHGEWLLVGAIGCFSLPPALCFIGAFLFLYVRALKQEPYARTRKVNLFKVVKSFTGQDFLEFKEIQSRLKSDGAKRNILIFTIGFWSIFAAIAYGLTKMFVIQSKSGGPINYDWFVKVFLGSL